MRAFRGFLVLLLLSPALLHADTTIRFKMDMKLAAGLPRAAAEQIAKNQKAQFPRETVVEIKGDKGYSNAGKTISLMDLTEQEITLVDTDHKLYATVYIKDFPGVMGAATALPSMPPAAQKFLESIKSDFSMQKTGKTDAILGIQAEETEWTISLQMQVPVGLPPGLGTLKPGDTITLMKMVMRIWTPLPAEATRVPALAEFAAHSWKQLSADPATTMQQMLPNFPGLSDSLAKMAQEMAKSTVPALKTHVELYIPVLMQLGGLMQGRAQPPILGTYDPSTPFVETDNEAVEISTAPIDASIFDVPSDHQPATLSRPAQSVAPSASGPASQFRHRSHPRTRPCRLHRSRARPDIWRFIDFRSSLPRYARRIPRREGRSHESSFFCHAVACGSHSGRPNLGGHHQPKRLSGSVSSDDQQ